MKNLRPSGVLLPVANGSESLETVAIANLLRRAEIEVTLAAIEPDPVIHATRGLRLVADSLFLDVREHLYEAIVLPGGEKGAEALSRYMPLIEMLHAQDEAQRCLAAICAAPALALAPHHFLDQRRATCYPSFRDRLAQWIDEPVVGDGHLLTGQGPAHAVSFALALVERLRGAAARRQVAAALLQR